MGRKRGSGNYPHAFKRQVVAETFERGATVAAVARVHGPNANMIFQWRKDERFMPSAVDLEPQFLPVEIEGMHESFPAAERETGSAGGIVVTLASGHRVAARGDVSVETFLQVVRELAP